MKTECICGNQANETGLCDGCAKVIDDIAEKNDCLSADRQIPDEILDD